jgi:UDP-N-acetylmuramoyl-tripeptide--D-alanyl-D-alanine ligase
MEPVHLENGAVILRDDYKSAPETIEAALDTLSHIRADRRIVVIGDINEPPRKRNVVYRDLGLHIAEAASIVIYIGSNSCFKALSSGAQHGGIDKNKLFYAHRSINEGINILQSTIENGDVVLIKGRSNQKLERITFSLMGEKVSCDISLCKAKINCEYCPMMRRGWDSRQDVS